MTLSYIAFASGASAGRARISVATAVWNAAAKAVKLIGNRTIVGRLQDLDDRMLEDIGVSRFDVRQALARPAWCDASAHLRDAARSRRGVRTR